MTADEVKAARHELGMTQAGLAAALELAGDSGARTVRNWEQGRIAITGPARVAIRLMLAIRRAMPTGKVLGEP
jgi:DNA-binding transcriptional regulator YiaG